MDISAIPKVERHYHLEGVLSADVVSKIQHTDPDYPLRPQDSRRTFDFEKVFVTTSE